MTTFNQCLDDMNPRVLKPDAFKQLDRVISLCAEKSIYTVIDMHSAPGGSVNSGYPFAFVLIKPDLRRQSGGWHADGGTHLGNFWRHKDFQDRFVWLWAEIATHYKDNTWIAGYNVSLIAYLVDFIFIAHGMADHE